MERLEIKPNYLVPVKSNCDGELIFAENGYEERWYKIGEVVMLPWKEIEDMRRFKRAFFEHNWVIFEATKEYTASQMYGALGVESYYPDADQFKSLDEVISMKPKDMSKYLQEVSVSYRESVAEYAKSLYESGDARMDSKAKVSAIEKVLGIDFNEV